MDITLYISRFLHRIRYQLILGALVVTAFVAYFTQFMQKKIYREYVYLYRHYI